ncbi:MAG: (2Fe-2S)-binding protein [Bacillota bacterium]
MKKITVNFVLNGKPVSVEIDENRRLLDMLREECGLTGTKEGCGVGECGACTVIVDGEAVNSCLVLAASVGGKSVMTVEGVQKPDGTLDPVQQAILDNHALQCGYCTPGFVMSAKALLMKNPHPTRDEIRVALSGNLCRCTGYEQIIQAVEDVASGKYNEMPAK